MCWRHPVVVHYGYITYHVRYIFIFNTLRRKKHVFAYRKIQFISMKNPKTKKEKIKYYSEIINWKISVRWIYILFFSSIFWFFSQILFNFLTFKNTCNIQFFLICYKFQFSNLLLGLVRVRLIRPWSCGQPQS